MADRKILYEKLFLLWKMLSNGCIILIYKDNMFEIVKSPKKTIKAQIKEINNRWIEADTNPEIKAIIWTSRSTDSLHQFIEKLSTIMINKLNEMSKTKMIEYLIIKYKKFFLRYKLISAKDRIF